MTINVELNPKSIRNTIKLLKKQKQIISEQMLPEYMYRTAEWIKNRANEILNGSDIGVEVVQNITSSWHIDLISNNRMVLYNMSWKSAYVEFGVGIVGGGDPHPNASKANYQYNVDSPYKYSNGGWDFTVSDQSKLDIPQDAIIEQSYGYEGLTIYTQGTKGVWYLFNAVEDYRMREQKRLWEEIKKKYWS